MRELSDVVLTRLVQVTVHMPGARWDPTALAEAEGVSEDEVHQVVRALRRAGLVDGVVTDGTLALWAPHATDEGVHHLVKRQALDGVLPGFVRVAGAVLDALEGREHLEYHEAAVAAGLEGHEVQPYLHLLRRIRMVRGMPSADGILMHVSRVF